MYVSVKEGDKILEGNLVGFCGRICNECLAFIAKQTNDYKLRKKAVEEWSSEKFSFELEDINCDGCTAGGELFKYCTVCKVRKCGLEKGVKNCAHCAEYSCEKLERLWTFLLFPNAKEVLDKIKRTL